MMIHVDEEYGVQFLDAISVQPDKIRELVILDHLL